MLDSLIFTRSFPHLATPAGWVDSGLKGSANASNPHPNANTNVGEKEKQVQDTSLPPPQMLTPSQSH